MSRMRRLWRGHRLAVVGFVLATALALVFAGRSMLFWLYWSDPAHREAALEGWMTPGYVARSWGVERAVLAEALGLEPATGRPPTLAEIAAARGVPLAVIEAEILAAIAAARGER